MKKIVLFLVVAAIAALTAVSCSREINPEAGSTLKSNQFCATTVEGDMSKVAIDGTTYKTLWEAGDLVGIFDGEMEMEFTAKNSGESTILESESYIISGDKTYYAAYPSSAIELMKTESVVLNIPSIQTPAVGTFPENYMVSTTSGSQKYFAFRNVCGLVEFTLSASDVTDIVICGNNGESLAGQVEADYATAGYSVVSGSGAITLHSESALPAGQYFVAVLPQTFSKGISIAMNKADGTQASKTTSKAFTLQRSHRVNVQTIDGGTFAKVTEINSVADLAAFLINADKYVATDVVKFGRDVDVAGASLIKAKDFAGTLDGDGKSIKNFRDTPALFSRLSGIVENLNIDKNSTLIVSDDGDAAFFVKDNAGVIDNCHNYGTVMNIDELTFTAPRHLGVFAATSTGTISNCVNDGDVLLVDVHANTAASQWIGGIAGMVSSQDGANVVVSCVNNGKVHYLPNAEGCSARSFVGGICGGTSCESEEMAVLRDCTNNGEVKFAKSTESSKDDILNMGGVIGFCGGSLNNCDNTASVTVDCFKEVNKNPMSRPAIGGVAGTVIRDITACDNSGDVTVDCVGWVGPATGDGVGMDRYPAYGGVVGQAGCKADAAYTISNCSNTASITINTRNIETKASGITRFGSIAGYAMAPVSDCTNSGQMIVSMLDTRAVVGGIAGEASYSVSNCTNEGDLFYDFVYTETQENLSKYAYIGGIVGNHAAENGNTNYISNVCNSGDIYVDNGYNNKSTSYVGGIVGYTETRICGTAEIPASNIGNISISGKIRVQVGGIVGSQKETCVCVVNSGSVTLDDAGTAACVGGIAGVKASKGNINDVHTSGDISVYHEGKLEDNVRAGLMYGVINKAGATAYKSGISGTPALTANEFCYAGAVTGDLGDANTIVLGDEVKGEFIIEAGTSFNDHTFVAGEDLNASKTYLVGKVKDIATQLTVTPYASVK